VIRFEPDGSVDDTFGESGLATATATATNQTRATAVGLRPDGRIVVAGDTGGLTSPEDRATTASAAGPASMRSPMPPPVRSSPAHPERASR
jgi:hypothetical protein